MTETPEPLEIRRLTPDFAVSGQIFPEHVADLAAAGFKAIVCNRPDNEAADQPPAEVIKAAAEAADLAFYNIPVSPAGMSHENVDQTRQMLQEQQGPIFAYCRSGARSTNLWQLVRDHDA